MNLKKNYINDTPCYKCEDRVLGCHSTCEAYIQFDKRNQERREKHLEEFLMSQDFVDNRERSIKLHRIERYRKKK